MNKSELLNKWQEKLQLHEDCHKKYKTELGRYANEERMFVISSFIEDLKNLNGETVKLRETCPSCGSTDIDYDYVRLDLCLECGEVN